VPGPRQQQRREKPRGTASGDGYSHVGPTPSPQLRWEIPDSGEFGVRAAAHGLNSLRPGRADRPVRARWMRATSAPPASPVRLFACQYDGRGSLGVDSGLRVILGHYSAQKLPRSPNPPGSFAATCVPRRKAFVKFRTRRFRGNVVDLAADIRTICPGTMSPLRERAGLL
jgi:hypothetical protein